MKHRQDNWKKKRLKAEYSKAVSRTIQAELFNAAVSLYVNINDVFVIGNPEACSSMVI